MQTVAISDMFHRIRGFFHVKPEQDAPWTGQEVVAYTSDFMHISYYVVIKDGYIRYFVTESPFTDDDGEEIGWEPQITGYGSKDESIHIIHASVADHVEVNPQWVPFEFCDKKE